MDYKDNFHEMIARYNRELLSTYRRGLTEPPLTESPPAADPPAEGLPSDTVPTRPIPSELGFLQVWVTTASSALPIQGAHVTVSFDPSDGAQRAAQYIGVTDESGRTEVIPLPAVSAQVSLSPEGEAVPFTPYNVEVYADGFFRVENIGVPMYGGVRAVQPVRLIPLPEGARDGELVFRDQAPQGLEERT